MFNKFTIATLTVLASSSIVHSQNYTSCMLPGGGFYSCPATGTVTTPLCYNSETRLTESCNAVATNNWHLLTKSRSGVVSLQHGLTKDVCEHTKQSLMPHYSVTGEPTITNGMLPASDIVQSECFQ